MRLISEQRMWQMEGHGSDVWDNHQMMSGLYADGKLEELLGHDLLSIRTDERSSALIWRSAAVWTAAGGERVWVPALLPGRHRVAAVGRDEEEYDCIAYVWHDRVSVGLQGDILNPYSTGGYVILRGDRAGYRRARELQRYNNERAAPMLNAGSDEERKKIEMEAFWADMNASVN